MVDPPRWMRDMSSIGFGAVFEGYCGGCHWFFGVDALQSVLTGAAVGAAESVDATGACSAVVWGTACVGAMAVVTAILCIVLRPHVVRFELLAAVVVSLLAVLAAVLILADDVNGAAIVSLVAAAMELLPLAAGLMWKACLRPRISVGGDSQLDDIANVAEVSKRQKTSTSGISIVSPRSGRRMKKIISWNREEVLADAIKPPRRRSPMHIMDVNMVSPELALKTLLECVCGKT